MNKDFKIGLIIGLAVLIAGIAYFIIFDSSGEQPKSSDDVANNGNDVELVNEPIFETETSTSTSTMDFSEPKDPPKPETTTVEVAVSEFEASRSTAPQAPADEAPAPAAPAEPVAESTRLVIPTVEKAPVVTPGFVDKPTKPAPVEPAKPAPAITANDWAMPDDTPSVTPVTTVGPVASTPSSYVVKAGDVGWFIAEKVYGKGMGRYWTKIRDANKNVDFNNLRPGLVLKIPALPTKVTQRILDRKRAGQTIVNASGQKVYIVSKNDTKGLWGISVKFYNKGQYWPKIAAANPGVKADQLRPGMKLIIPDLANTTRTRAYDSLSDQTYGSDTVTAVSIRRNYYTVRKGDSYWTIAQKEYGNGKYAYLIKNANPGVNPNNLRPGLKLVIPPKPESTGSATPRPRRSTPRRRTAPAAPIADDEPDFGL